ncbi:MAG: hypothetical protein ACNA8L_01035 [Luteolibacter sp.]
MHLGRGVDFYGGYLLRILAAEDEQAPIIHAVAAFEFTTADETRGGEIGELAAHREELGEYSRIMRMVCRDECGGGD